MSVVVEDLTKAFGERAPAVHHVSFEAPEGAITSLLGPSGSGKSTVLRIVAGLTGPDSGRVRLNGEDVAELPPQKRGVGFVFQSYSLFTTKTVFENIAFGLRARHWRHEAVATKVQELLQLVQLNGFEQRYPSELSGGQRQRIAFARALAIEPRVFLLDEPFAALDRRVRLELREWFYRLHERTKVTTILVTHDQQEAMELSHNIVVMDEGRVVQAGTPRQIYDEPATPFVAGFVWGAEPLSGVVHDGRVRGGVFDVPAPANAIEGTDALIAYRASDLRVLPIERRLPGMAHGVLDRLRLTSRPPRALVRLNGHTLAVDLTPDDLAAGYLEPGRPVAIEVRKCRVFPSEHGRQPSRTPKDTP